MKAASQDQPTKLGKADADDAEPTPAVPTESTPIVEASAVALPGVMKRETRITAQPSREAKLSAFHEIVMLLQQEYDRETTQLRGQVEHLQNCLSVSFGTPAAAAAAAVKLRPTGEEDLVEKCPDADNGDAVLDAEIIHNAGALIIGKGNSTYSSPLSHAKTKQDASDVLLVDAAAKTFEDLAPAMRFASETDNLLNRWYLPERFVSSLTQKIREYGKWAQIREPERKVGLALLVNSVPFRGLSFVVVLMNAAFIVHVTNTNIELALDESVQLADHHGGWVVETCFATYYTVELFLRLLVHRSYFFFNNDYTWNIFDLLVTMFALFEIIVKHSSTDWTAPNINFLRLLRVTRLAKIFRVFRGIKFLQELRLKLELLIDSFVHVFWWVLVIIFILFLFALIFVQALADAANDNGDIHAEGFKGDSTLRERISREFPTVPKAMVKLFQASTGGTSWEIQYDLLGWAGSIYQALYLFFIAFFLIAILNIVNATFVEKAFKLALPDIEGMIMDKHKQDAVYAKELMQLLNTKMDSNGDGLLSAEEFAGWLTEPDLREFFAARGLEVKDAESFFRMLTHDKEAMSVPLTSFVAAALRLQGQATSVDLQTLHFDVKHNLVDNQKHFRRLEELIADRIILPRFQSGLPPEPVAVSCGLPVGSI